MAQPMTLEQAIAQLTKLIDRPAKLIGELGKECELVRMQWEQLGRVGGQRADHAAQLLLSLKPALSKLVQFFSDCAQQIDGFAADPFGREQGD